MTDEAAQQEACPHTHQERLVDKLGLMTEKPDGTVSAPILAWHVNCVDCGTTLLVSSEISYDSGDKITVDKVAWALGAGESKPPPRELRPSLWSLIKANWRSQHER